MNMEQGARTGAPLNTPIDQRSSIKAIPTRYKGCHFRSRLEARWAVLLDALLIPWEYEEQGYETPLGPYLPDFRLRDPVRDAFLEIKPSFPSQFEIEKMRFVASELRADGLLTFGQPMIGVGDSGQSSIYTYQVWPLERYYGFFSLRNRSTAFHHAAVNAARSARFEHGYSGAS